MFISVLKKHFKPPGRFKTQPITAKLTGPVDLHIIYKMALEFRNYLENSTSFDLGKNGSILAQWPNG